MKTEDNCKSFSLLFNIYTFLKKNKKKKFVILGNFKQFKEKQQNVIISWTKNLINLFVLLSGSYCVHTHTHARMSKVSVYVPIT